MQQVEQQMNAIETASSSGAQDGATALNIAPRGKRSPPRHDEILIAQNSEWVLTLVGEWSNARWASCKLYYVGDDEKKRRVLFYVGVSEGRHSRNRDVAFLQKHHPDVLEWTVEQAMAMRRPS